MVLWWIGNAILLLVVLPVVIFLLNRVLAAVERIRGATDDILSGGVALVGELNGVPEALAVTDTTIEAVSVGAVRYAGSVAKLLLPDDPKEVLKLAREIKYPVIIKAAAGGGGRGMRVVHTEAALLPAVSLTKAEAMAAFGNATVYMEKYLDNPRHLEIQVLSDAHKNTVHLFERDCSMQRRHQKIIEEAPAPDIPSRALAKIGERAVEACRKIDYRGVGSRSRRTIIHSISPCCTESAIAPRNSAGT